ncbi:Ni/Fe-hydrogenase 2 integral membrane subunit HybB [Desulfuromonas soudanensis]|uniref:Ni/Fe-hydrogenase 2 integral membrane subunit HybB n=1 Tax=Desulfuromonas soudanensis TaxID=1603606 RepID=A0A0M5IN30_9BACT|nr:NrfD/PsrC family molybdoenzyme membrane anchor subunit [Desulfuromonas soudanensis]ALC15386.1 Ni/Fe-hydrogenase 2 integral membrane subunit HybB [Desulfuromonas soudanensis]
MTATAKRPGELLWFALLGAGVLIGAVSAVNVLIQGHAHVYNVTREVPWGILIATYVFFVVSSTGLCLVSSLGHVFGIEKFELIGRRAIILAIITLITGFGAIGMEINHPIRLGIYAILSPNFSSPIWWMGTLYGLYLALLCGEFYFLMRGHHKGAFALGMIGFIAAVSAHSNLGAVFGLLEARPYWHGSFLPIYFILSALVSGGALVALFVYFNHKFRGIDLPKAYQDFMVSLGKLQALFLVILIFFVIWKIIPGLYGQPPGKYEATMATLTGPLAFNFWFFEVLIGLLIPVTILLNRATRTPFGVMVAGLLSTVGIFFMRYDLVIAGQLVPMREGVDGLVNGLLTYTPSITELGIVIGAMAFCLLLYSIAEKFLSLGEQKH